MNDVLVIVAPAVVKKGDFAAIGFAQQAAERTGGAVDVLLLGPNASAAAERLQGCGARTLYAASPVGVEDYTAEAYAASIAVFFDGREDRLIVAATSSQTREVFPRLAALTDRPVTSDVVAIEELDESSVSFTRAVFVGNLLCTETLEGPSAIVTCRPSEFEPVKLVPSVSSPIEAVELSGEFAHAGKRYVSLEQAASERPDLKEADIIVSVGRGTKGPDEGIPLAEELADALGAALGGTRAVVDAGWLPNEFQVGQTGKIVAPKLYIAIGLSGAIQHLAGMRNAKNIVAINKDQEAPIFEVADLGLIADLFQAVPELIAAVRSFQNAST